ncbi:GNAT family N-acetyltransferase [Janibacter alittae]|uniref:GNAT family N-acetyltransferase n=1 Tax=Janibacter alittae TaxID=3115209 RepID=A0ABZ2MGF0_9MICO
MPDLAAALLEQQPGSGYPHRHPLPYPAEQFIQRPRISSAWVAEIDERPVGHIAISTPADPARLEGGDADVVRAWERGHGRPHDELGEVAVFFTATAARGTGTGAALLATAVESLREQGLAPCLDVVPTCTAAMRLYRRAGWHEVGRVRPGWLSPQAPDVIAMVLPAGDGGAR